MEANMRYGVCCIVLGLEEYDPPNKFQKMTYSKFSKMNKNEALEVLGSRILNNIQTTFQAIKFCYSKNYCYRLSSDLFPLVTYDKAEIDLQYMPHFDSIKTLMGKIKSYLQENPVRISTHPDQFNVLASENKDAVQRTIKELNFQSWVMDELGCPSNYNSPINIHLGSNKGDPKEIMDRFVANFDLLDENCRNRIVLENDDKTACWSVRKLFDYYYSATGKPITFDFLHHKCHPDNLSEEEAIKLCHSTWATFKPLFHFSESRDEKNPRAHSDYPSFSPRCYGLDFDLDFEFKMKEKSINLFETKILQAKMVDVA
jgi:UV DNA damage endonuclease